MTPEERRAFALRARPGYDCGRSYPACCQWHEGFDNALALLVPAGIQDECANFDCEWAFNSDPRCDHAGPRLYTMEVAPEDESPIISYTLTEADRAHVNAVASFVCNCPKCNARRTP